MLCTVSHTLPQPPQLAPATVSQPLVSGALVSQLAKPALQLAYVHLVPSHVAPLLLVESHTLPHPPQLVMVLAAVSQPLVSGAVVVQFAKPGLQLV